MEKQIFIKDENKISETISLLNQFAQSLESNLNLLNLYNDKFNLIDNKYIYEISTFAEEQSRDKINKHFATLNPLDDINTVTYSKFNNLIKILFAEMNYKKLKDYPEIFKELTPLKQILITYRISSELENKDSFNFDFVNNKVTVKSEIIDYINEKYTTYLTTKNQLKAFDIMKNINNEIIKLKEVYNVNNDTITNDLLNDIYKCYPRYNLYKDREIDYHSVYKNIISKVKD